MSRRPPTWRDAWQQALYGPAGFYVREAPAAHFRTSVHTSALLAEALVRLGRSAGVCRLVDVGAGRAELLEQVAGLEPGWDLRAVEVAPRPAALDPAIGWTAPPPPAVDGALVVAHEWLDVVPCEIVEVATDGAVRVVHVDPATGAEELGDEVDAAQAAWLERWWDLTGASPGSRAEVGLPRDVAWAGLVRAARRSLLVAVDYAHRVGARPSGGTLAGYRAGREVAPRPDGTCDITAHVALDSCAAAGRAAGATASLLTEQREALRVLGVDGRTPPYELGRADPQAYLSALVRTGEAAELLRPGGLGGFGWLVQGIGLELPDDLRLLAEAG